jgi:hypothetical protein
MGFMSGFLQGAEGMNNIQNQWLQMNATRAQQQAAQDVRDAQATAQATQEIQQNNSNPTQGVNTGVTPTPTSTSSNPDGTQPAPGPAPVTAQPLADPSSLPDPDSAKGEPDGEKNDPFKSKAAKDSTDKLTKGMKAQGIKLDDTTPGADASTVAPDATTTTAPITDGPDIQNRYNLSLPPTTYVPAALPTQSAPPATVPPDIENRYNLSLPPTTYTPAALPAQSAPPATVPATQTTDLPAAALPAAPSPVPTTPLAGVASVSPPPPQTMLSTQAQMQNRAPGAVPIAGQPMGTNTPFGQKQGANVLAPTVGGTPRLINQPDPNLPGGGQGKPQPSQSAPAQTNDAAPPLTFAQRAMGFFGVGTAQADELPPNARPGASSLPGGKTPPPQPTAPPGTNPKAAALPMAKTDDGDSKDTGYRDPGAAPSAPISKAIPTGGPTATTGTKVVPDQKTPTNQSQPPVPATEKVRVLPYDPKPYAALILATKDPDPEKAQNAERQMQTLEKSSRDTGVPADQLALHWNMEAGMRETNVPRGKDGEIGPFQILPSTWDQVDPTHMYDPNTLDGGAHIAGLILNPLNNAYGVGSPAVAVGYNAGPQNAARFAAGKTDQVPPSALDYMKKCFPGQNPGPTNCTTPPSVDPTALQAAMKAGPDATMRYIAQTAPDSTPLGQKWAAAETSLVYASLMKGDVAGAQQAQELILGMSRQGASNALMNADRALAAGDGTTAAQQLAVAHAFFPDGSFGKFGVDSKGQVWAQQFSEKDPTLALGQPFQVTRQNLQPQLVMTSDPNKYLSAIQTLNQQNAQTEFEKQHGAYFGDLIKERGDAARERAVTAQQNAHEADATRNYALALHSQELEMQRKQKMDEVTLQQSTGLLKEREEQQAKIDANQAAQDKKNHDQYSKEVETLYGPGATQDTPKGLADPIVKGMNPQQRSAAALAYYDIRSLHSQDMPMPSPTAYEIANSLVTHDKNAGYSVNTKKGDKAFGAVTTADGRVVARLQPSTVARLIGSLQPPAQAPAPRPLYRNPALPQPGGTMALPQAVDPGAAMNGAA